MTKKMKRALAYYMIKQGIEDSPDTLLQLETKQQKNCPYCHGDILPVSVWGHSVMALVNLEGNYVICADLKDPTADRWITQYTIFVKYCPMCGRKLEKGKKQED